MKNIGIWMDKEKALIVTLSGSNETIETIYSKLESYHIGGGSGTRFKGGPQDVVQDSKYLEREKHQLRAYFKNIVDHISLANNVVIFGPAEAAPKFRKELQERYQNVYSKVRDVLKEDSMSINQVRALIRDYFGT